MTESEEIIIGLCGGIGSGKSTVARLFAESGATVIDADRIAHEVLKAEDVKREIGKRWGMAVIGPDGEVDRATLGHRIFTEDADARELDDLVHPRIRERMDRELSAARRRGGLIVIDAPLLLEVGLDEWCDALVFVEAPEAVREERVRRRHGWTPEDLARRQAQQMTPEAKRAECDFTISNGGALTRTAALVRELSAWLTPGGFQRRSRTSR